MLWKKLFCQQRELFQLIVFSSSSFSLLPSPSQTFHLHSCLAAYGSSHFHSACILSDVIPAGADLRQLLLPGSSLLSGLKILLSTLLNPSSTIYEHTAWSEIPWSCKPDLYLSFFPLFLELYVLLFFQPVWKYILHIFFWILKKNLLTLPILDGKTRLAFWQQMIKSLSQYFTSKYEF